MRRRQFPAGQAQQQVMLQMVVHPVGREQQPRERVGIGRARVAQRVVVVGHHGMFGDVADAADQLVPV